MKGHLCLKDAEAGEKGGLHSFSGKGQIVTLEITLRLWKSNGKSSSAALTYLF